MYIKGKKTKTYVLPTHEPCKKFLSGQNLIFRRDLIRAIGGQVSVKPSENSISDGLITYRSGFPTIYLVVRPQSPQGVLGMPQAHGPTCRPTCPPLKNGSFNQSQNEAACTLTLAAIAMARNNADTFLIVHSLSKN
ncbi:TPA: hypothetical protein ACFP30_001960 [Neisseria oralis]